MIRNALPTPQASFVLRAGTIVQLGWKVVAGYSSGMGGDPKLSVFSCCVPTIATEKDSAGLHHRLCSKAL